MISLFKRAGNLIRDAVRGDREALRRLSPLRLARRSGGFLVRMVTRWTSDLSRWVLHDVVMPRAEDWSRARLAKGRPRSLWGVTPILTLPLKARADRLLGFRSHSLVFVTYHITKNFDFNLRILVNGVARYWPPASPALDQLILAWALARYDVFHFFYDRGLMPPVTRFGINPQELDLLRAAGKRVYLYAYGADVRRREATLALGAWNFCKECPEPGKFCICDDETGTEQMESMCARATQAVALGDMLAYVPGARNMHYWPIDLEAVPLAAPPRIDGPLRIVHAPNHMHFKGSHFLETVIEALRAKGDAIEYVKVQGVPNAEVIRLFGEADLVADQFIGGAYGYTALEAMARGKPVLTYVRGPELIEAPGECPLINVTPETLEATLLWCLTHRDRLAAIGAQGRVYVDKWHSISAVASRFGEMYEETAAFPEPVLAGIRAQRSAEEARRDSITAAEGWHHPFRIGVAAVTGHRSRLTPHLSADIERGLTLIGAPARERWHVAGLGPEPRDAWASYDRSPWNHPWLTQGNMQAFSHFSRQVFDRLGEAMGGEHAGVGTYGFVGNIANIGTMRASGLRRHIPGIDLHLPPHDTALMSLPAWEDFDGDITELGDDPSGRLLESPLPARTSRLELANDWSSKTGLRQYPFVELDDMIAWPDHMPYVKGLKVLNQHGALLVSQFLSFGYLSRKPYIVAPMGGEIWFDAARDDALGRITRRSLQKAACVLVSNPITLAHARRHGINNCLYLPFVIDEERYKPGSEPDIRAEWEAMSGGAFFVLTSMRLDNQWKGAHIALEGFARFVKACPQARLLILGWGVDASAAKDRLAQLGIADKVLLLPIVGKKRLARYLRAADALIEQFVLGYFGASGLEAMASGLPVVMRIEKAQYDGLVPEGAPPVLDADNAASVAAHLQSLFDHPEQRQAIGAETRRWFLSNHASSARWKDYKLLLDAIAMGVAIDWSGSPLTQPPSAEEADYHRNQLAGAPPFPVYEL
jgi:glycosyltransferase involved in cell wall biosynthesis